MFMIGFVVFKDLRAKWSKTKSLPEIALEYPSSDEIFRRMVSDRYSSTHSGFGTADFLRVDPRDWICGFQRSPSQVVQN